LNWKTIRFVIEMRHRTSEELKAGIASNLKAIRKAKGLAQERLALDAVLDRTVEIKTERGVTNPSSDILLRLTNHLDFHVAHRYCPMQFPNEV